MIRSAGVDRTEVHQFRALRDIPRVANSRRSSHSFFSALVAWQLLGEIDIF